MINNKRVMRLSSFLIAASLMAGMLSGCGDKDVTTGDNDLGVDTMPAVTDEWGGGSQSTITKMTTSATETTTETSQITESETESSEVTSETTSTQVTTESTVSDVTTTTTKIETTTKPVETVSSSELTIAPVITTSTTQTTVLAEDNPIIIKPNGFTKELQDLSTTLNVITSEGKAYWYEQLNEKEENAYNKMLSAVLKYKATVTFDTALTAEEYSRVFALVYNQNPELFWLSGKTVLSADGLTGTLFYAYNEDTAKAMQVKLDKRVQELLDMMNADMTDLEKILLCHDYIVKYNSYSNETKNSTNAFGCIIEGKSQCSGYAKGMQYLCDQLKIPCIYVNGVSGETGNTHAWNQIKLGGDWYNVDVMWDDPYMEPEDKKNVSYRYMGVPDNTIMGITHLDANTSPTKDYTYFDLPDCTATTYNADIQYGVYADSYEEIYEKLKKGALDAVANGRYCAHVKVKSRDVYLDALDRLITQKEVYNIRDVINAEYGAGYVVGFAAAPENEMNYIEITLKYGEGFEPR